MRRVALHVAAEITPHSARRRFGGIGRTHDLAPLADRVLALEDADEHGSRRHELAQAGVERALFVHDVEARRVLARQLQPPAGDHAQPLALGAGDDLADLLLGDGVGFHDRERAFLHCGLCSASSATIVAPISAGLRATRTPAASKAAILSAAVPRPPAMMAP